MNPFSWLFHGAASGATEGLMINALKGVWDNGGQDAVRSVVKEKMPNWLGIGVTDEAKWAELLTGLLPQERDIITVIKAALDKHHQARWRLVITSIAIEGLLVRTEKAYKEYWPLQKGADPATEPRVKKEGTEVKDIPALRNSSDDPRIKHLHQVCDLAAPKKRAGKRATLTDEGIGKAKAFLFTNFVEEKRFSDYFVEWLKKYAGAGASLVEKLKKYSQASFELAQDYESALLWQLTEFILGEEVFSGLINARVPWEEKRKLFDQALAEKISDKQDKVRKRRGLPGSFWIMLGGLVCIMLITALVNT
jgi:hypothetical protein